MRPSSSIEGLVCTVTLFQLILKNFKQRQHFVDLARGASFERFDAHSSMGAKEKHSLTQAVLQNAGDMSC